MIFYLFKSCYVVDKEKTMNNVHFHLKLWNILVILIKIEKFLLYNQPLLRLSQESSWSNCILWYALENGIRRKGWGLNNAWGCKTTNLLLFAECNASHLEGGDITPDRKICTWQSSFPFHMLSALPLLPSSLTSKFHVCVACYIK